MNITCLLGVILCYGWVFVAYYSLPALIIMLNGIIYHLNPKSEIGRKNDIVWNTLFLSLGILLVPSSGIFISIGLACWFINNLTIDNDIAHVLCVQFPIALGLRHAIIYS